MELKFDVIIDSSQAKVATHEIDEMFDKMSKSSKKSIRQLSEFGASLSKEMKEGKLSTKDAKQGIEEMQEEIRRLAVTGKARTKEEKQQLRLLNIELTKLNNRVTQYSRSRTDAHRQNIRQIKEEQRETARLRRQEEIADRRSQRTAMLRTRYAGRALRGAGLGEIGGMLGTASGFIKFGAIGAGITALSALVGRYKSAFQGIFDFIQNMLDNLYYYIDMVVQTFGIRKDRNTAEQNYINAKVDREREEYDKAVENIDKLGSSSSVAELTKAINNLRSIIPTLSKHTDDELVKMKKEKLVGMLDSEFDSRYRNMLSSHDVSEKLFAENYRRIDKFEERIKELNKMFDDALNDESIKTYDIDDNGNEVDLREQWQKEIDELTEKIRDEREAIQKGIDSEYRRIKAQNNLTKIIEKQKKDDEEKKKWESAKNELRGLAKIDTKGMPTYDAMILSADQRYRTELESLQKLATYKGTKEYEDARRGIEARYQASKDEANKFVSELFESIDRELNQSVKAELQRTLDDIERKYDELEKRLLYSVSDDRKEEYRQKIAQNREIEKENAILADNIRLIEEEGDAMIRAIEISSEYTDEEQKDIDIMEVKRETIMRTIDAIRAQNDISEDEEKRLRILQDEYNELKNKIDLATEARAQYNREARAQAVIEGIEGVGGAFAGSSNEYMSMFGSSLQNVSQIREIYNARQRALKAEDRDTRRTANTQAWAGAISAAAQFASDAMSAFAQSAERSRQVVEDWNAKMADSAHRLALMTIEEYEYKQRNIFGVESPYDRILQTMKKEAAANEEAMKAIERMADGQVQTGYAYKVNGKTTAQTALSGLAAGAAIGAAAGSAATPVGTAIGAVVGAVSGLLVGLFAGREKVEVYDSLRNKYGNLYDEETLELNKQILADYDKMDDATKRLIDNAQELLAKQKEAHEEYLSYIQDLVGTMGDDISNQLADAFRSGNIFSALDDVKSYLTGILESLFQKEIYAAVFGDSFDGLQAQLNRIRGVDGQISGRIDEIIAPFLNNIDRGLVDYDMIMKQIQERYRKMGYDLFSNEEIGQEALQGAISGMTEETAGKINGNFMGLKLTAMEIADRVSEIGSIMDESNRLAMKSASCLQVIADNTAPCRDMARDLAEIKNNGILVR